MPEIVTLIPGDGCGPEVMYAAKAVIEAAGADIVFDIQNAGELAIKTDGTPLPQKVLDSITKNKTALKGPVTTPIGTGFRSVNVALRQALGLYANLRPAKNYPGITTRFSGVDIVVVRENTEDLYAGIERMADPDTAESIKRFTRAGCERILRYAFTYAEKHGRKKVTAVHKANIMKLTDGMFLSLAREIAKDYPDIVFEESIVDAICMRLVTRPEDFDVLVCPNLYGDILSDLCAGLVGGLGVAPSANIGDGYGVFEPIHGSAPDIAGQNIANPSAAIFAGVMMLKHLGQHRQAENIENALLKTLVSSASRTPDLGGTATTTAFTEMVIKNL